MADAQDAGNDLKAFSEDFNKKMQALTENIEGIVKKTGELDTKIESIKAKPAPKKEDDHDDFEDDEFFDDDDKKIDRKIEKKFEEKVLRPQATERAQRLYAEDCAKWDAKAAEEFPLSNKKFSEEVTDEMHKNIPPLTNAKGEVLRDNQGKSLFPPDAVYNAAARVFARKAKQGEIEDEALEPEDMDTGGYRKKIKGRDMETIRMDLGNNLGLKPEQVKRAYERYEQRTGRTFKGSRNRS